MHNLIKSFIADIYSLIDRIINDKFGILEYVPQRADIAKIALM